MVQHHLLFAHQLIGLSLAMNVVLIFLGFGDGGDRQLPGSSRLLHLWLFFLSVYQPFHFQVSSYAQQKLSIELLPRQERSEHGLVGDHGSASIFTNLYSLYYPLLREHCAQILLVQHVFVHNPFKRHHEYGLPDDLRHFFGKYAHHCVF